MRAGFWETDELRDGFLAQHIGKVSRAYRKHPAHIAVFGKDGISQEVLGSWFNLSQAQVSRIENGPPIRNLDTLCHWARTLRIPQHLLWFKPLPGKDALVRGRDGPFEAVELARLAKTSTIAQQTLEMLDETVERLACDYPRAAPKTLIARVRRELRYVKHLLTTPLTLAQRRHLTVEGGWLALLLAVLQFDIGDRPAAEAIRDAAYQLGREGGHQELMAWTHELLAWFALVEGAYPRALDHARAGRELAPNSSAAVQLAVQEAKAWAKLGRRDRAEEALLIGGAVLAKLPAPVHPEHHFVFDGSKLSFYAATVYAWLGERDRAEAHALHVIEQCMTADGSDRWPTRLAVAHVDLGLVAAQRGEYAEAAARGALALASGRVVASTMPWLEELDGLLVSAAPGVPEVAQFHHRLVAHRAMAGGDGDAQPSSRR